MRPEPKDLYPQRSNLLPVVMCRVAAPWWGRGLVFPFLGPRCPERLFCVVDQNNLAGTPFEANVRYSPRERRQRRVLVVAEPDREGGIFNICRRQRTVTPVTRRSAL